MVAYCFLRLCMDFSDWIKRLRSVPYGNSFSAGNGCGRKLSDSLTNIVARP